MNNMKISLIFILCALTATLNIQSVLKAVNVQLDDSVVIGGHEINFYTLHDCELSTKRKSTGNLLTCNVDYKNNDNIKENLAKVTVKLNLI
jgi:hypothetical protein